MDVLYGFLLLVGIGMTALIFFFVFLFAIKYRRKSPEERPKAIHGSIPLEIAWSVIPFLIMLVMFGWGTKLLFSKLHAAFEEHTRHLHYGKTMDVEGAISRWPTRVK